MIKYGDRINIAMISMNEEESVKKVIQDIKNIDNRIQVIIVDSSNDKTAEIAQENGAKVIRQIPAIGYSPAMDLALKSCDRDIIITMDCDDTYPVDKIDLFSKKIIDDGFDVVDGNRLAEKPQNMPYINFFANYFFAMMASILFLTRIKDLHSGMRAYKKNIIKRLPYSPKSVSLPVELILWPLRLRLKVCIIDIPYRERIGQSKLEPLKAAYWTIIRIIRARFLKY